MVLVCDYRQKRYYGEWGMNQKHQQFINEYLICYNRTQAALAAGYSPKTAYSIGARLLKNVEISKAISERLTETAMSADEVLKRLADHARGDLGEFLNNAGDTVTVDLSAMKQAGKTHLIKKITQTKRRRLFRDGSEEETVTSLELYDAQAAQVQLGKHHKLFVERNEVTVDDTLDDTARATRIAALLDLARERRDRSAAEDEQGDVEAVAGATD